MKRPGGPIRIARTRVLEDGKMLVADLSGASRASVAAVVQGGKYFFVAPVSLGGTREVPACSLTDAVNSSVGELSHKAARRERRRKKR